MLQAVEAASRHRHAARLSGRARNRGWCRCCRLEAPAFDTYFVYPEELKESKRVAVFRDFIVSKAKEWKY